MSGGLGDLAVVPRAQGAPDARVDSFRNESYVSVGIDDWRASRMPAAKAKFFFVDKGALNELGIHARRGRSGHFGHFARMDKWRADVPMIDNVD